MSPRITLALLLATPLAAALPCPAQTWEAPLAQAEFKAQPSWLGNPAPAGKTSVARTGEAVRLGVAVTGTGMKFSWSLPGQVDPGGYKVAILRYRARAVSRQGHYLLCFLGAPRGRTDDYQVTIGSGEVIADERWHTVSADLAPVAQKLRTITGVACDVQAAGQGAWLEVARIGLAQEAPVQRPWDSSARKPGAAFGAVQPLGLGMRTAPYATAGIQPDAGGGVTVEGIPFRVEPGFAASTGLPGHGSVRLAADARASEVYLLLEAEMQGKDDAIRGGGKLVAIWDVDRFAVRLAYADGTFDEVLPVGVPGGFAGIGAGGQVIAAPADHAKRLTGVEVVDRSDQLALHVLAASIRTDGRQPVKPAASVAGLPAHLAPKPAPAGQSMALRGSVVTVASGRCLASVDLAAAPTLRSLRRRPDGAQMLPRASRLLGVEVDGHPVELLSAAPPRAEHGFVAADYTPVGMVDLRITVWLSARRDGLALQVAVVNTGQLPHKVAIRAGTVGPYRLAASADAEWYLYPKRGAALDNRPCSYNERYSGLFPLQFVDTFAPAQCVGLSLRTEDRACAQKRYRLDKGDAGFTVGVDFAAQELKPSASVTLPATIVTVTDGAPTRGMEAYRAWLASWFKPIAPRKPWFQQIANFRQRFLHWIDPLDDGKSVDLQRALDEAKTEFGGIDYLHLFDWGNAGPFGRSYGRPGDTEPWPYISGGREALSRAVARIRAQDVPVGLYIEGYLLESNGKLGKTADARAWQIIDERGKPRFYPESTEMFMCPAVEAWRDIQARTYADAKAALGPAGMYVDEFGFGDVGKDCWAPNHGHAVPSYSVTAEAGMLKRIRDAVGPGIAIYSEETPADVNSALQDGSFTYAMNQSYGTATRAPLNLARFCLPGFKTIEILICDQPTGSWATGVKQVFFNGEAIWLEGPAGEWFAPQTREAIRRCHAVLRAHREAFAGDHPQPLIPTLKPGLYCNRFEGGGETVYTLYNATPATLRGDLLSVPCPAGKSVRDAFTSRQASVTRKAWAATVRGEIGPYDVGCFVVK